MARLDRLGQEVIAAFAHGVELFVHVVFGRQIDDRHADVALIVANHLGQLRAGASWHVHIEDDQIRLEFSQFGHRLNRVGERTGDDACGVEQALGVQCLRPRVVNDQRLVRLVLRHAGQHFNFFHHAGDFERAGQKRLATCAHSGQPSWCVGLVLAEKQQGQFLFKADLGLGSQFQALAGFGEINVHHDGGRMAFGHGVTEGVGAGECQGVEFEKLQLLGQALCPLNVLQQDVDRFAQRRQCRL